MKDKWGLLLRHIHITEPTNDPQFEASSVPLALGSAVLCPFWMYTYTLLSVPYYSSAARSLFYAVLYPLFLAMCAQCINCLTISSLSSVLSVFQPRHQSAMPY